MSYHVEAVALICAEAAGRRVPVSILARRCGLNRRTLSKQLAGEHPITRENALLLLRQLDADGPWLVAGARETLVILSHEPPQQEIRLGLSTGPAQERSELIQPIEPGRFPLDTVMIDLAVKPQRRSAVERVLSAAERRRGPRLGGGHHRFWTLIETTAKGRLPTRAALVAGWDKPDAPMSVRLQFHPGHEEQLTFVRALAAMARGSEKRPDVTLIRGDIFVDLPVDTWTLFPTVLRARSYRRVQSGNAAVDLHGETLYVGSRYSKLIVRLYDLKACHRLHDLQGPATRVEAELRFSPALGLWSHELDDQGRHRLSRIKLHASQVPELPTTERALLLLARREGVRSVRQRLKRESDADRRRFDKALALGAHRVPIPDIPSMLADAWPRALWQLRVWLSRG